MKDRKPEIPLMTPFFPSTVACYLRTLRYLKWKQFANRCKRKIRPAAVFSTGKTGFSTRNICNMVPGVSAKPTSVDLNEFTFLNVTKRFDPECFDWSPREMDKLWRYNLHYFDYLGKERHSWSHKAFLINDWIEKNPPGTPDAWEPFPVSLRIVNWIKFILSPESNEKAKERWLQSLYQQALWLEKNIEYHLLANHLFKNGKALFFAGMFFDGTDAERLLAKGLRIITAEISEQILPDGGHFERSPMYHAMILEDCLDLLNLAQGTERPDIRDITARLPAICAGMIRFQRGMTHPDGGISLFNDAAFGIEPSTGELVAYYERLTGEPAPAPDGRSWSFPDTGYFVMAPRPGDRLIIDCGPVGPDYQPGHSHCDTLSFELSLGGKRIIVDSGCAQYVDSDIRRYNRGNMGHNTITIDGENQSEVWGAHRCGRRAYPLNAHMEQQTDGSLLFTGAHNGYRHLAGRPVHHRSINLSDYTCLIEDRIEGHGRHDIEARLHIHPDLAVELAGGKAYIRGDRDPLVTISMKGEGAIRKTEGWYCPEFGIKQPCVVLTNIIKNAKLPFTGSWTITAEN